MMKLALGTVQFGLPYGIANQTGQVSRSEVGAMLQLASTRGIDLLDTAIAYGESETCLGDLGVQGFKVVSKLPAVPDGVTDVGGWVREQAVESLSRLGIKSMYGLLLHRSEQLLGPTGAALYRALRSLKDNGHVQKVGVSIYAPDELGPICKQFQLDLVQAPFNLVDRRLSASGWLGRLKDQGVEVHTRSAFLQGLLLMPQSDVPLKFSSWNYLWERWHQWLREHKVSGVQAALAFPLAFPEIDRVIVGADSASQLAQLIDAAGQLPGAELPDLSCDAENLINPSCWPKL